MQRLGMDKFIHQELPPPLRKTLDAVGKMLDHGRVPAELGQVLRWLGQLPPEVVFRAEREIADAARLWFRPQQTDISRAALLDLLGRAAGLEFLLLFHRDGYVREAALRKIGGGLNSAFVFSAVALRLNDWVPQVREAAAECAGRTFPLTDAESIARAAVLLARERTWGRWGGERERLLQAFARPDVTARLADVVAASRNGPMAGVLRQTFRLGGIEPHLMRLAREAAQPAVRAIALGALIEGAGNWISGYEWRWVDKPMNIRRRAPVFDGRPLEAPPPKGAVIAMGVADRSAVVRKVALDGLIRFRAEVDGAKAMAEALLGDRSAAVRERAEFVIRKLGAA